jgi:hypothetical protein
MSPRGGRIKGSSYITVQVSGVDGVRRALAPWLEPELTAHLDAANKRAAQTMAKELRAEAKPVSKHMSRAVRVKRARTGKPGWVVGSKRKIAFFWHMVIGGTRDHGPRKAKALVFVPGWNPYLGASSRGVDRGWIRAARVRGVGPNPIVERVARQHERRVAADIDRDMTKATGA